ncbi:MAG: DUF4147 domain-containing protein [Candidatus Doudnabacteria bacterium]|nr:DUF4147 domain-containing protein [Candidatus Doudnabacteria bacterium]
MIIINYEKLASSELRASLLKIAEAGFASITTPAAIQASLKYDSAAETLKVGKNKYNLKLYKKVYLFAFGKAAKDSAETLKTILGQKIYKAFVLDVAETPDGSERCVFGNFTYFKATHPKVSEQNIKAAAEILSELAELEESDLVLCSTSGGGSAIFEMPYKTAAEDAAKIFSALTKGGATISELNTVRKHISLVKGGQLAKSFYPATVINLLFSDVPGNDISVIASGPLVLDKTTVSDAKSVLDRYDVLKITQISKIELVETPKEKKYFERVHNLLIVSPDTALNAMKDRAEDLGFNVRVYSKAYQGEARLLGPKIVTENKVGECLLGAGESTVKILGNGIGGRNQEMALSALEKLKPDQVFGCFASDGHDNSESAGAIVDTFVINASSNLNIDYAKYLNNNDSFTFFDKIGSGVQTGLTGSNVADFFICLRSK